MSTFKCLNYCRDNNNCSILQHQTPKDYKNLPTSATHSTHQNSKQQANTAHNNTKYPLNSSSINPPTNARPPHNNHNQNDNSNPNKSLDIVHTKTNQLSLLGIRGSSPTFECGQSIVFLGINLQLCFYVETVQCFWCPIYMRRHCISFPALCVLQKFGKNKFC